MTAFFTKAFNALPPEELEAYHRTVFMQMDTPHAAALRQEYWRGRLRRMGTNVTIGCGVTFLNPQSIALGDNVSIDDRCTLIALT
jgi:acetyltransferase-like isoleucine patch superfamily enzyme